MQLEVKIPTVGESITEVTLAKWRRNDGDIIEQDEVICELESEKATFELPAEKAGKLKISAQEGAVLKPGDVIGSIDTDVAAEEKKEQPDRSNDEKVKKEEKVKQETLFGPPQINQQPVTTTSYPNGIPSPAADKIIRENELQISKGTGKDGRITKGDALKGLDDKKKAESKPQEKSPSFSRNERREKMSSLRKTVSKHLVSAKNTTAMLTTFNEVDMKPIMDIRSKYKEEFKEKFGVGLGFMSFFAKAVSYALREWQSVNAFIDGDEIVFHDYCDISIAVSTPKGLVVPVIRNAESLSFAEIEAKVADLAKRGRENKLSLEEMSGGTFTITNGGVFGSLMSTPIINIPQSAILGMHKIEERPVVKDGQIVIRPMMYVALSYDHRIIDGRESVSFLVTVKEFLEHPEQLLAGDDPVKLMLGFSREGW